ncbi:MAG TPA: hypothetical protein VI233_06815 [Puia sp.]
MKLKFTVQSTILDRSRLLVIDPEYIEFDDQNLASETPTRFLKAEIEGLRYGLRAIRGYSFRIGRIYGIDIRDVSGRVIKIRLKTLYGIRKKLLEEKYQAITDALFRYYFHDRIRYYLRQFQSGQPVELLGVHLNKRGILFDETVGWINWNFLGTKRYWHYYTLYSEAEPNHYKAFVFWEDWNAGVLIGLIETIVKSKTRS